MEPELPSIDNKLTVDLAGRRFARPIQLLQERGPHRVAAVAPLGVPLCDRLERRREMHDEYSTRMQCLRVAMRDLVDHERQVIGDVEGVLDDEVKALSQEAPGHDSRVELCKPQLVTGEPALIEVQELVYREHSSFSGREPCDELPGNVCLSDPWTAFQNHDDPRSFRRLLHLLANGLLFANGRCFPLGCHRLLSIGFELFIVNNRSGLLDTGGVSNHGVYRSAPKVRVPPSQS